MASPPPRVRDLVCDCLLRGLLHWRYIRHLADQSLHSSTVKVLPGSVRFLGENHRPVTECLPALADRDATSYCIPLAGRGQPVEGPMVRVRAPAFTGPHILADGLEGAPAAERPGDRELVRVFQ